MEKAERNWGLTGNMLKLIAALSMTLDHAGLLLFDNRLALRILGRLALPLFAFLIAEGCRYTRSRGRYLLGIFLLGSLCQVVYYLVDGSLYLGILFTFSLSILTIYALQNFKDTLGNPGWGKQLASGVILALTVALVWIANQVFAIDYGFAGCMLPVWAALLHSRGGFDTGKWDAPQVHGSLLMLGLLVTGPSMNPIQCYGLLAWPLLLCYNGKRGSKKLKWFFYIFYPLHLALIQGIAMVMAYFK